MTAWRCSSAFLALCIPAAASVRVPRPLCFERNVGQAAPVVSFLSRWQHRAVLLTSTGAVLESGGSVLALHLDGANPRAEAAGLDLLPLRVHYLIGAREAWQADVPTYGRVAYRNIYPGIDLVYYGSEGHLDYDLIVNPGAEVAQIRLRFEGAGRMRTGSDGDLFLPVGNGEWRHTSPRAYQIENSGRQRVSGRFISLGADVVGLDAGKYDRNRPLVMTYSTYLGGSGQDAATSLAVDVAGNAYITGWTESTDFSGTSGTRFGSPSGVDTYVAKLSPSGNPIYITYLGGSGDDRAYGIGVDNYGAAILVGSTYSANFPVVNAAQARLGGTKNGFIAKLNPAGNGLVFSTYLGGSGADSVNAAAVDGQGSIYVAGETTSANFPVLNAFQPKIGGGSDAFVARFSSTGARTYASFLGGAGDDRATAIAVDAYGGAFITGSTYSPNFPLMNPLQSQPGGGQDAFAARIGPAGNSLVYSTYIGGSGGTAGAPETGSGIAVDSMGCAYIAGATSSPNFPVVNAFQSSSPGGEDAFVLKLNALGGALVYSTYLGGSSVDLGTALAVDGAGRAYVTGYTASTDFPVANAVQSATNAGSYDVFVVRLSPAGNGLEMGTYLGGSGSDSASGIALDANGNVYVAGQTFSINFPIINAVQVFKPGSGTAVVAELPGAASTNGSLNANLVSFWSADGDANDSISGYNGTLRNGAAYVAGRVNQAFSFNGLTSYVQISGTGTVTGNRTISAWVFPNPGSGGGMPVFTGGAPGAGDFVVISGNRIFVDHWGAPAYYSNIPVVPGAWNYIVLTYDGSALQFYINGVASQPSSGTLYSYGASTLKIGGNTIGGTSAGVSFNGLIDEVRLYSRALSANEVQSLYCGSASSLTSHWSADGNANDSVSGYNGSLVNGAAIAAGKVNQAFSLNGVSSRVQINGPGVINGPRTLSAWIYPNPGNGGGMPILTAGMAGAGDFLVVRGNQVFLDHWGAPAYFSSLPVVPGAWNHVAISYDGSALQFYVNGAAAQPVNGSLYNYGVGTLAIGGNTIGGTTAVPSFNGLIDEVYLYSRALSAAEVQSLYAPAGWGPASYWSADGNANDSVSGYNGTLMNGATFAAGRMNQAFSLNGISSYVQINGAGAVGGPRTISAWVHPNSGSSGGMPILTAGTPGAGDFIVINGNRLSIDHWGTPLYSCSLPVTPGAWNHVAVSYDGATIQFYVNGLAAQPVAGALYGYGIGTLTIGGNTIGGTTALRSFNGMIDEVNLYLRPLSAAEVRALYNGN